MSTTRYRAQASTDNPHEFAQQIAAAPDLVRIVAEGDSWFDFPRKHLIAGPPQNVIDHVQTRTRWQANLLRLASNGDEIVTMASGDQRDLLCSILEKHARADRAVDLLLLSGGGNDVAGRYRLDRLLKPDASGARDAASCFRRRRLSERMRQIELAYVELLDVRDRYSPGTIVLTHTYSYPYPDGRPARFLRHRFAGPWLAPYLVERDDAHPYGAGVPPRLREPVCRELIDAFAERLLALQRRFARFEVVDTRPLLARDDWQDELHPKPAGFEKVARALYAAMRRHEPRLKEWRD